MKQLGYVQRLDKSELPNVEANLLDSLREPSFDPEREFAIPWQSGMAAIIYRKDLTRGEISSVNDLFDPKFKGKVTMLTEMRDTVGLVMLSMGVSPSEATLDEMLEAVARIEQARDDGQFRRVTGNDYGDDLAAGNTWLAIAWSGDVAQLQLDNPDLQFVVPDEGATLWSDNMLVPVNASNQAGAEELMNFVYEPEQAALITNDVQFISPVAGVEEFIDPELAANPLINPTEEMRGNLHIFRGLTAEENEELVNRFESAVLV
jgi:spermidine/putrescine transport system substrate-binding protein